MFLWTHGDKRHRVILSCRDDKMTRRISVGTFIVITTVNDPLRVARINIIQNKKLGGKDYEK